MQQVNLSRLRVLIVGAKGYAASLLRGVLSVNGINRVCVIEDAGRALDLLRSENFDIVFIEEQLEVEGKPFPTAARRSKALINPLIPIILVCSGARRRDVERSRDLGVNDVITRPFSPKTLMNKLVPALMAPRPFIAAPQFFGPDRRSKLRADAPLFRQDRRKRKPQKTRIQIVEI